MTTECAARHHDTYSHYKSGCICPVAREDYRIYRKRGREGRRQPSLFPCVGATRQVQAMMLQAHSCEDISRESGVSIAQVWRIARGAATTIQRSTAKKIEATSERLSGVRGDSERTAAYARRSGYAPLLAWVDIDDPNAVPEGIPGQCVIVGCANKAKRDGSRCWSCIKAKRLIEEAAA